MSTENPCHNHGCMASCCKSMTFLNLTRKDLQKLERVRPAQKVELSELRNIIGRMNSGLIMPEEQGIYYAEDPYGRDTVNAAVVGRCPNLATDNSCRIYDSRPDPCRSLQIGSLNCTKARRKDGLPRINHP